MVTHPVETTNPARGIPADKLPRQNGLGRSRVEKAADRKCVVLMYQRRSGRKVRLGRLRGRLGGLTIVGCDAACPAECQTQKCLLGLRTRPRGRL
jgi:hypothetical protein